MTIIIIIIVIIIIIILNRRRQFPWGVTYPGMYMYVVLSLVA